MYYRPEFFYCESIARQMPIMPVVSTIYVVRPGDTLSSIANRFNTTVDVIVRANNIEDPNVIYPGQRLIIPRRPMIYVVQPGDTLYSIAGRYNVSLQRLILVNRLENPNVIYPGMRIIIPFR